MAVQDYYLQPTRKAMEIQDKQVQFRVAVVVAQVVQVQGLH
jgi:hypothetical protein